MGVEQVIFMPVEVHKHAKRKNKGIRPISGLGAREFGQQMMRYQKHHLFAGKQRLVPTPSCPFGQPAITAQGMVHLKEKEKTNSGNKHNK